MNDGDTAWVLASTALVMLMTPGVALFYGGMTRARSVLNMMMMSFAALAIVSVLWVIYGYSITFGLSDSQLIGGFDNFGLHGVNGAAGLSFVVFQLMFAIITPALVSGAIAGRAKFLGWCAFVVLWTSLVYFPVANWVFDFGAGAARGDDAGWIVEWGVQDFAGGTAVHVNAGAAGLALALVLGKRLGWKRDPMRPHNLPLVLLGAGLLWFGWFGFNAGSALAANALAATAFVNTQAAAAAAIIGWLVVEQVRDGRPTSLGADPAPWRAWWLSRRPVPSCPRWAPCCSACSPAAFAHWRSDSSGGSATTTHWTWSAFTSSGVPSARWHSDSSPSTAGFSTAATPDCWASRAWPCWPSGRSRSSER
jgi:Amt family ammonium transporter